MANQALRALTTSTATSSQNGTDLENISSTGGVFVINTSVLTGTAPTVTYTIEGADAPGGNYYTILASAAISATGTVTLKVYPGMTAAANTIANDIIPRFFRVKTTTGGTVTQHACAVTALLV